MDPVTIWAAAQSGRFWLKAAPWLGCGLLLALLVGVWKWDAKTIDGLTAERDAMMTQRDQARASRDMAAMDAQRWMTAVQARDRVIEARNAEVEAARADLARAEATISEADQVAKARIDSLRRRIAAMEKEAHEKPDQVRPVGPIARSAAGLLKP
jgi:type VI protein secretion system component VasK